MIKNMVKEATRFVDGIKKENIAETMRRLLLFTTAVKSTALRVASVVQGSPTLL